MGLDIARFSFYDRRKPHWSKRRSIMRKRLVSLLLTLALLVLPVVLSSMT